MGRRPGGSHLGRYRLGEEVVTSITYFPPFHCLTDMFIANPDTATSIINPNFKPGGLYEIQIRGKTSPKMSVSGRTYIKPEQMQKSIKVQTLFSFIKVTNKAKNSTKLPCNVDNSWGKHRIRNFCYFSWYLTFKLMHRNLKKVPAPR